MTRDGGASRKISPYNGNSKYAFYALPNVRYQITYQGPSRSFKAMVHDGQAGETYLFDFQGKSLELQVDEMSSLVDEKGKNLQVGEVREEVPFSI